MRTSPSPSLRLRPLSLNSSQPRKERAQETIKRALHRLAGQVCLNRLRVRRATSQGPKQAGTEMSWCLFEAASSSTLHRRYRRDEIGVPPL